MNSISSSEDIIQGTWLLDTHIANSYNNPCAEVAQLVEQRTENPRVPSSTLGLGTRHVSAKLSRSGGMVDATVSKTVEGQLSCRFESDLRHQLEKY